MVRYGQTIKWADINGAVSAVTVKDCDTPQEALAEALDSAKVFGWTPPRWWQWWRWNEPVRADLD